MNEKKFAEVFSDKEFVNKLLKLETGEKVVKALAEKGIVITPAELDEFAKILVEAMEKKGELKIEDLSKVHGGSFDNIAEIQKNLDLGKASFVVDKLECVKLSDDALENVSGGFTSYARYSNPSYDCETSVKVAAGALVLGIIGVSIGSGLMVGYSIGRSIGAETTN